jgi:hypothetical protein
MAVATTKGRKPPQPERKGFATTHARAATFQQLTRVTGFGSLAVAEPDTTAPFYGANAVQLKQLYHRYAYSAQSCIARALAEPTIAAGITNNTGTAPELVLLGNSLLEGLVMGRTLFFQSKTFRDPIFNPSGRVFNVDILKVPFADQWLEPVDGVYYHLATLEQELRDADRNNELAQYGHVLAVSDVVCQSREQLQAFLAGNAAP